MSISMGKRDICLIIAIRGLRLSRTHRRCSYSITSISIPCKVRPTRSRRTVSYKAYQLRYDPFDICKPSYKSVPNECKNAPSVGEGAFGKFYMNARSFTRRVRGTCW